MSQSPVPSAVSPFTQVVTDLKLAACYRGLGFPYEADGVIHATTGKLRVQFRFQLASLRFPTLNLSDLHPRWLSGELSVKDPMHVLCVMMAAQHNYDMLIKAEKEQCSLRLVKHPQAGEHLMIYETGQESPALTLGQHFHEVADQRLAAALGLVGLPVIRIDSNGVRHIFTLPNYGHPVLTGTGEMHAYDLRTLVLRAPTKDDPLRLALEDTQPLHPVVIGYDALYNRTELKRELSAMKAQRLIDQPGQRLHGGGFVGERLAVKQALVDVNAPGYVMDHVTRHMGSPPIVWD